MLILNAKSAVPQQTIIMAWDLVNEPYILGAASGDVLKLCMAQYFRLKSSACMRRPSTESCCEERCSTAFVVHYPACARYR